METGSASAELTIKNRLGLHARAAAKIVRAAEEFKSDIKFVKDGQEVDARSVLSLLSLGCAYDSQVIILAAGDDAQAAVSTLSGIIEDRFGEE